MIELAEEHETYIGGDDFKSGQTKMKSVLVDFLVSAGIKPTSIVSYNHLGNNDGRNLSAPQQFRSKEISKSNVVDDMVASNRMLYEEHEHPDHVVSLSPCLRFSSFDWWRPVKGFLFERCVCVWRGARLGSGVLKIFMYDIYL